MQDEPILRCVSVPLSGINLMGDLCLVRPDPPDYSGPIFIPECNRPDKGELLHGVVVKTGPGDRVIHFVCVGCGKHEYLKDYPLYPCSFCGKNSKDAYPERILRARLGVVVGDRVLYWRSPANEIVVDSVRHEILHEEQHIVAVLEG